MFNADTEKLLKNAIETLSAIRPRQKRQHAAAQFLIRHAALLQADLNEAANLLQTVISKALSPEQVKALHSQVSVARTIANKRAALIGQLRPFLRDVPETLESEITALLGPERKP